MREVRSELWSISLKKNSYDSVSAPRTTPCTHWRSVIRCQSVLASLVGWSV